MWKPKNPYPEDPLLRSGSFIDPTTSTENNTRSETTTSRPRRTTPDPFSWLPPGWQVVDKVRTSGATAGSVDKYYIEPTTNRRFRSKREVQFYLETGAVKKKKRGEISDTDASASDIPGNHKQKKSRKNEEIRLPKFDPFNVPDRVEWALVDAIEDAWTPFIGGEKVAEPERLQWDKVFASVTARK